MTQVSRKLRITTMALLFSFCWMMTAVTTGAVAQSTSAPPPAKQTPTAYVQGTDTAGNALSGVLTVTSFANTNNQLVALGTLNGTITSATGVVTPFTNQPVTMPVSGVSASCPILNLVLGPLNLNILGLQITLNQVVLNIVAIPGAGKLLGNLLCDVANLLNGTNLGATLDQLVADLNAILAAL